MIKHIAFIAYAVKDINVAKEFYEGKLGLKLGDSFGETWQEYDLENGTIAVVQYDDQTPDFWRTTTASLALEVDDLNAEAERLKGLNVEFAIEPMDYQICKMCCIKDPDGNIIALHQVTR